MFSRLSIRYKIGFIALIGVLGFAIFQAATYRLSVNVRDQLQTILTQDFAILKFANQTQVHFSELEKSYQASLAEADEDVLKEADNKAMTLRRRFESMRRDHGLLDDVSFNELYRHFEVYVEQTSGHTADVLGGSLNFEQTLAGYAQVTRLSERYQEVQQRFIDERYKSFEGRLIEIEKAEEALVNFGVGLGSVLLVALLVAYITIIRSLIRTFGDSVTLAKQIAAGNLDSSVSSSAEDETGQLLASLYEMRDVLKLQKEDSEARAKIQSFLAGLNETMRGDKQLDDLASTILSYLAKQLQAQHGAIYIFDTPQLKLLAEYARPVHSNLPNILSLGETMVGQIALEKEPRIMLDIPDRYMTIGSGIGAASPRSIMLFPVVFEDRLKAVIELAAFHRFSQQDLDWLLRANNAIATAINSSQTRNEILSKNQALEDSRKALIEKTDALEQSGRYKSQFLSTMSHELRTPLNSILILSQALMENRKHHLEEREVQHARVIHNAGGDLLALINDILDLSKVEEGKMELVIDEIDVQSLANTLTQQFEFQARERGLHYSVDIAHNVPHSFFSDRHRLKQIIKNFISNAFKFTEKGGVFVGIKRPDASYLEDMPGFTADNSLLITVRDTGVGIEKAKQGLIFEAFKQADGTTSRKYGGTGLGLTISRELAKLLKGEIILRSAGVGHGAEFALLVPIGEHSMLSAAQRPSLVDTSASEEQSEISLRGDEKVLIIEDNPVFQEVLRSVFANFQLNVHIAENGVSALKALDEARFDCLVVDLNLPDYDGLALLEAIRHRSDAVSVPIIVFTAEDLEIERRQQVMRYADQIATKSPKAVIDVCRAVRHLLVQRKVQQYQLGSLAGKTVLLVDDDERNLYSITSVLEGEGLQVIAAKSGAEALSQLANHKVPDIMLLDIMMPEMDGYEVLKRLREDGRYQMPVIALTAKAMLGDKSRCLQEGATAYLAKPVSPDDLLNTIATYIH